MAARFDVPIRPLVELVRLGYFEVLTREGRSAADVAKTFGQSSRHMRSLAQRLQSDFFRAEKDVGIIREAEEVIAAHTPTDEELTARMPAHAPGEIAAAVEQLVATRRAERAEDGRLRIGHRYQVMASEQFHHRIDALNHYLDGVYRAVVQRLVFDDRGTAMIKTITFSARREDLARYLERLEGDLRRELAALEEAAAFDGVLEERFTIGLALAMAERERELEAARGEAPAEAPGARKKSSA